MNVSKSSLRKSEKRQIQCGGECLLQSRMDRNKCAVVAMTVARVVNFSLGVSKRKERTAFVVVCVMLSVAVSKRRGREGVSFSTRQVL